MSTVLQEFRETLFPKGESKDGPLPRLLTGLTFVTGLVDSFSFLTLNHVFVANMTGNVVFLAFALAGAKGFSVIYSLLALVAFLFGSLIGDRFGSTRGSNRGRLLSSSSAFQLGLVLIGAVLAVISPSPIPSIFGYGLIASLSICMGIQNAVARKISVLDFTTTVLTLTLTGIGAESRFARGTGSKVGRRLIPVIAMTLGALLGASLVLYVSQGLPLLIALPVICAVSLGARYVSRSNPAWATPK